MSYPTHPLLTPLLAVPAALYGAFMNRRNRRYDRPGATVRASLPIVSVGNLTVGGTGKTPTVAWIASHLLDAGRHPAVVSRGYGGRAGHGPLTVSVGDGPQVSAAEGGDEPWWLAHSVDGLRVVVGSDRVAGAEEARRIGADVVVLDDGFQHRRLARDVDIVLVDAAAPFGNHRLLPAGPLREAPSSLCRADLVIATRAEPSIDLDWLAATVSEHAPGVPLVLSRHRPTGFVDADRRPAPAPPRALAFCGIGQPESFRRALAECGVEVTRFHAFGDHHDYTVGELRSLRTEADENGAALVTTEKDLARIGALAGTGAGVLALAVELEVLDEARLASALAAALSAGEELP